MNFLRACVRGGGRDSQPFAEYEHTDHTKVAAPVVACRLRKTTVEQRSVAPIVP